MTSKINGNAKDITQPLNAQDLEKKDAIISRDAETDKPLFYNDDPPLPPDGGWGWVVMIASFFINLIVDGVCYTYGIINVELAGTFEDASKAETALVGSLVPAVYLMVGPFVSILANRFGCRLITILGSIIAAVFFFISSFSNNIIMMMFTYGVMGGIGFGMMYLPSIVMVGYYFDKYRALATGIAVCGSGIGTFVFAPMATYLVEKYAWRGCNIIIAAIILHGILFGATFRPLHRKKLKVCESVERSVIMEHIRLQKNRNRTVSGTSEHDGAIITDENLVVFKPTEAKIPENEEGNIITSSTVRISVANSQSTNQVNHSSSGNHISSRTSMKVGSRASMRSGAKSDVISVMDRQDVLYPGSIKNLPEYQEAGGDHVKYVQSMQTLPGDEPDATTELSKWKAFQEKALGLFDFTLLRSLTFVVLCLSGVLVFVGLYTPFVYLHQKALDLGATKEAANLMITLLGIFNTISRIATGALADRKWVDCLIIHNVAAIVGGVATCIVPVLNSYILLCLYAALFGIAIAAFIALRSIVLVEMLGIKKLNNAFGLTSLFQGISVLVGSPISGALYEKTGSLTTSFVLCGVLIILGGVICLPVRRIAAWENARETNFHEDKGSHYKRIDETKNRIAEGQEQV